MKYPLFLVLFAVILSPLSAEESRPNILFCIADDASFPHMGAYGCTWVKTPGFDRVAREGILFNNAYTPNAKCAPSRACILTGRNSWQLEAAANHWCVFPQKFKTYAEALTQHGYHVGKTAKGWGPGTAPGPDGKRRQLTGTPFENRRLKPPTNAINRNDYAGNFGDFLKANSEKKPWCFWYGCTEPHRGYEFQSGAKKGGKKTADVDEVPAIWPDTEIVRHDILDYAFEIEHFDNHLVRMLGLLEKRGELQNTIVVVTADNGMPFPRVKGQEYGHSNHLPLAIMWPKGIKAPGRTVDDYVNFIDFAPTFLQAAGVSWEDSGLQPITGSSLFDIFNSEKAGQVNPARDHVLIGKERHDIGRPNDWGYPIRGIVKDGKIYLKNFEPNRWPAGNPETGYLNTDGSPTKTQILNMRRGDGPKKFWEWSFGLRPAEEMFDLKRDPWCLNNLASNTQQEKLKNQLKEQMEEELKQQQDPRILGNGEVFLSYPYADKNGKGFYERYMKGEKMRAGWVSPTDFEKQPIPKK